MEIILLKRNRAGNTITAFICRSSILQHFQ